MTPIEKLYKEAKKLAGRPIEVISTKDGEYVVEYFNFNSPPPPKAKTEEAALHNFISWLLTNKVEDIVENKEGTDTNP